jgi:alkanesulfonate monooxygenase SsuD/methylene tetrahydromethanopterin reductase-like flavin-dependent oxidoreductase (luciferase family)
MGPKGDFDTLKKTCLNIEKLGYDLVTIWDHLLTPKVLRGFPYPPIKAMECWTTLAGLAAATEKIQLGSLVTCVHFRHPTMLAKMAVTVDNISNGRLILGLGAGWMREEFKSFFGRYPGVKERLDGLEDTVIICKSMLENEHTSYQGKVFSAYDIPRDRSMPTPVRGHVPIMIGGMGEKRTLKIAAKHADIIHFPVIFNQKFLEHKIEVIKKHCKNVGRDFDEITLSTMLHAVLDPSDEIIESRVKMYVTYYGITEAAAKEYVMMNAGVENIINSVKQNNENGIKLFTLSRLGWPIDLTQLESFKKEVIQKL